MLSFPHDAALIIVMDDSPMPAVKHAADRRHWPVLHNPRPAQLAEEFKMRRPAVVLVQVAGALLVVRRAARFIRWMREHRDDLVGVLALAAEHSPQIERVLREAGVAGYMTQNVRSEQIDQAVRALLGAASPRAAAAPSQHVPAPDLDRGQAPEPDRGPDSSRRDPDVVGEQERVFYSTVSGRRTA